jgi:EAL domain-containing protein (putative c-di-GMP-specific phosphodiesterase class I)
LLVDLGIQVAQGYLLGEPVSAEQLYDRLRASPPSQLVVPGVAATPA